MRKSIVNLTRLSRKKRGSKSTSPSDDKKTTPSPMPNKQSEKSSSFYPEINDHVKDFASGLQANRYMANQDPW